MTKDQGSLPNGNHPVSAEPSTTAAVGSNPSPRTLSSTHRIGSRYIQEIEPQTLSEILTFGFWMQKTGYSSSTIKTCIRSLKAVARRTRLLDPESVKGYLATAKVSVNRKQTVTEHLARFYKWKRILQNHSKISRFRRFEIDLSSWPRVDPRADERVNLNTYSIIDRA